MSRLKIAMAQLNPLVGDIEGNTQRVLDACRRASEQFQADVVLCPELTLTGYPPEDLLLRPSLEIRVGRALERLQQELGEVALVVGYPRRAPRGLLNVAGVISGGRIVAEYAKQHLPNYQVFDEVRYFVPGRGPAVVEIKGVKLGLSVCEDVWHPGALAEAESAGAELVLNLNASPFHMEKLSTRIEVLRARQREGALPVLYVNQVGGQDELVFDGGSLALGRSGQLAYLAPCFEEHLGCVEYDAVARDLLPAEVCEPLPLLPSVYRTLVLAVRDYFRKNGFKGAVLGLSGGIDSALTLAVAVDALGAERVEAVMMPYHYTSSMSVEDASEQARRMGVNYRVLPIAPMVEAFEATLREEFRGLPEDNTEQNLQARSRGVLLMAISNKKGYLVLTTGNKSEMAVGYATLYGDMAGGFAVLKDVPKTLVFQLARYRNTLGEVIPERVITRPPSAELAPGQEDQDTLPPYEVLDAIIELYVERDRSAHDIIARGFEPEVVNRVLRMIDLNEYKRRQAAVGPRISQRAFGRDRRYPITSGWRVGD